MMGAKTYATPEPVQPSPLIVLPSEDNYEMMGNIETTLQYLESRIKTHDYILDVGEISPLSKAISAKFGAFVFNTSGDLDFDNFCVPLPDSRVFNAIIYSHTIEHQFNPLTTLVRLRKLMQYAYDQEKTLCFLYIMLPRRGKLLWATGHYHEIDDYRMRLLLKRAGINVLSLELFKHRRRWWKYFTGIRMILRYFFEYNAYYCCTIKT
jgi:hypothetical protein